MSHQFDLPKIPTIYRLRVMREDYPESPRSWDNESVMVCWHPRHHLGDKQPNVSPYEYRVSLCEEAQPGFTDNLEAQLYKRRSRTDAQAQEYAEARVNAVLEKHYVMLPLYLYEHGGITMSTGGFSCSWDSGQVGFIYYSVARAKGNYAWKRMTRLRLDSLYLYLENEVKVYDQYLTGEVYGYELEKQWPNGQWEECDTCCGFYGDAHSDVHFSMGEVMSKACVEQAFRDVGEWVTTKTTKEQQ
jgi:hypothetical protein